MQGGLLVGQEGKKPFSPVGLLIQPCSEQRDLGWEGRGERGWGGGGGSNMGSIQPSCSHRPEGSWKVPVLTASSRSLCLCGEKTN